MRQFALRTTNSIRAGAESQNRSVVVRRVPGRRLRDRVGTATRRESLARDVDEDDARETKASPAVGAVAGCMALVPEPSVPDAGSLTLRVPCSVRRDPGDDVLDPFTPVRVTVLRTRARDSLSETLPVGVEEVEIPVVAVGVEPLAGVGARTVRTPVDGVRTVGVRAAVVTPVVVVARVVGTETVVAGARTVVVVTRTVVRAAVVVVTRTVGARPRAGVVSVKVVSGVVKVETVVCASDVPTSTWAHVRPTTASTANAISERARTCG